MARRDRLRCTLESLRRQTRVPEEILLVVDNNRELFGALTALNIGRAVLHLGTSGCAAVRNRGWKEACGDIVVFLDDDAIPEEDWLERLVAPIEADPSVVATSGWVVPEGDNVPAWYPKELYWVFGCSWAGLEERQTLRNPIGASMAWRRDVLASLDGFNTVIGRVQNKGWAIAGCEETLAAIQATALTGGAIVQVGSAVVYHYVGPERVRLTYLLRRGWGEGMSKWIVQSLSGQRLGEERAHSRRIAVAVVRSLRSAKRWRTGLFLVAGLGTTAAGYFCGRLTIGSAARRVSELRPATRSV
jgi:cellulose synthase/poly-beta-1,6-N-acetylglucosamine synthase-like glycosyltransferase